MNDEQRKIVDYMLDVCGKKLMGFPRGEYNKPGDFVKNYMYQDVGPAWAHNSPITLNEARLNRLKEEGMVCIGLVTILLRCVLKPGKNIPSLDPSYFKDYKTNVPTETYQKNEDGIYEDKSWKWPGSMFHEPMVPGLNDTSEWLYVYHYKKKKIKKFSTSQSYPRGTLLFRPFDPYTFGHIAVVYTDKKPYEDTEVFHTVGETVGMNKVAIEPLARSHEYFSRPKKWNWDSENQFGTQFFERLGQPTPYYTHILLPKDYIDLETFYVPSILKL